MDIPEQLKNPYVIGGALVFLIVFYLASRGGSSASAALDPNASLAASTNVQLSQIASGDTQAAIAANATIAGYSASLAASQTKDMLTAYTANQTLNAQLAAQQVTSSMARHNDYSQQVIALDKTASSIELAKISAGVAEFNTSAAERLGGIQAQYAFMTAQNNSLAQTTIASYNATATSAAAASAANASTTGKVVGAVATVAAAYFTGGASLAMGAAAGSGATWV